MQRVKVVWSRGSEAVAGVGKTKKDATIAQISRRVNFFSTYSFSAKSVALLRISQEWWGSRTKPPLCEVRTVEPVLKNADNIRPYPPQGKDFRTV